MLNNPLLYLATGICLFIILIIWLIKRIESIGLKRAIREREARLYMTRIEKKPLISDKVWQYGLIGFCILIGISYFIIVAYKIFIQ